MDKNTSGTNNGGGPLSTGGPMGGPGRPGKRVDAAQQDHGDWTGPGVPNTPYRQVTKQRSQDPSQNPARGAGT